MKRNADFSRFASRTVLAVALAGAFASAGAQTLRSTMPGARVVEPTDAPLTPLIQRENGVEYVTGGIGVENRERLRPLGRDMSLRLVFAEKGTGAYQADVDVRIADRNGNEILTLDGSDPVVFAQLRPGTYEISATKEGQTIQRSVTVASSGQHTETFYWG